MKKLVLKRISILIFLILLYMILDLTILYELEFELSCQSRISNSQFLFFVYFSKPSVKEVFICIIIIFSYFLFSFCSIYICFVRNMHL